MCNCIKRIDEHLAKFNTKIELPLWSASGRLTPFVQTVKLDSSKRGKPRLMAASFCPFCGEEYSVKASSLSPDFSAADANTNVDVNHPSSNGKPATENEG